MKEFKYTAIITSGEACGETVKGYLRAEGLSDANSQLRELGYAPVSVNELAFTETERAAISESLKEMAVCAELAYAADQVLANDGSRGKFDAMKLIDSRDLLEKKLKEYEEYC